MKRIKIVSIIAILIQPMLVQLGCSCTQKSCDEGVSISVKTDSQLPFPEGEYILEWHAGDISGELEPLPYSQFENGVLLFWPNYDTSAENPVPTEKHSEITLELFFTGESLGEAETYELIWVTEVCNTCTGTMDDQETSFAHVEFSISIPSLVDSN